MAEGVTGSARKTAELETVTDAKSQSQRSEGYRCYDERCGTAILHWVSDRASAWPNAFAGHKMKVRDIRQDADRFGIYQGPAPIGESLCVSPTLAVGVCLLDLHLSCFQRVEGLCHKSHNPKEISGLSVIFLDISTTGVTI